MKTIKKFTSILIIIGIIAFIGYKLISNKKQLDNELKAMSEYNLVVPVEVVSPKMHGVIQMIQENGVVRPSNVINVLSETSGKVIYAKGEPGDKVSVAQTLVRVEFAVTESQLELAKLNLENAKKDLERFRKLAGGDAITQQQLEAIELNHQNALTNYTGLKKQFENTEIKSPVNGVIAKRLVSTGDNIMPSMHLFSILENKMVFVVKITGTVIPKIKVGQDATVKLDNIPDKIFSGKVRNIGAVSDMSGRYEVEINIAGHDARLREGLDGNATFEVPYPDLGLIIPRKCIEGSIHSAFVYLLQGDSVVTRNIQATLLNETEVLVTEGLSTNDKVVLSGQINLEEGTKVNVINL